MLYWARILKEKMKRNLNHYNKIISMQKHTLKCFNYIKSQISQGYHREKATESRRYFLKRIIWAENLEQLFPGENDIFNDAKQRCPQGRSTTLKALKKILDLLESEVLDSRPIFQTIQQCSLTQKISICDEIPSFCFLICKTVR